MPNRKNYPKNFRNWSPPYLGASEPQEFVWKDGESREVDTYKNIEIKGGIYWIKAYEENSDYVAIVERIKILNPKYQKELANYNKKLAAHKIKLAEWQKWKDKWDAEVKKEQESAEKRQYLELKKKYEQTN